LHNPYLGASFAVICAMILAVVFVVFTHGQSPAITRASETAPNNPQDVSALSGTGPMARAVHGGSVREGPGSDYLALGEMLPNQNVEVVGRNKDGSWLVIYYPPGSAFRGWVSASALSFSNDPASLQVLVLTPIPQPTVIVPTPARATLFSSSPAAEVTASPTGVHRAASISPGGCIPGRELIVTATNLGKAPLDNKSVAILIQAESGSATAVSSAPTSLIGGSSAMFATGYTVRETVVITLDPLNQLGDPTPTNNRTICSVPAVSPPTPALASSPQPGPRALPRP
jgi:hypothetical protein